MKNKPAVKPFKIGAAIQWRWMGREIHGSIKKIYFKSVTVTRDGKSIKRNGSQEKPAYIVKSKAGARLLKLHTELKPAIR